MATQTRHTEAMTDAYITGQRMRNALRAQCAIEQLGDRWLLHPDNVVTRESHIQARRERVEVIDTRRLRNAGFAPVRDAFQRAQDALAAFARHPDLHALYANMCGRAGRRHLLIEHEGGAL